MEVRGHFLTLAIVLQTKDIGSPWMGGWVSSVADLDTKEKGKTCPVSILYPTHSLVTILNELL